MSDLIAGHLGDPDDPRIPPRSFRRITNAVFDSESVHESLNREVSFRGIREQGGANISEVTVETHAVDGHEVDCVVQIIYRDGLFKAASVARDGKDVNFPRLGDALHYIVFPLDDF